MEHTWPNMEHAMRMLHEKPGPHFSKTDAYGLCCSPHAYSVAHCLGMTCNQLHRMAVAYAVGNALRSVFGARAVMTVDPEVMRMWASAECECLKIQRSPWDDMFFDDVSVAPAPEPVERRAIAPQLPGPAAESIDDALYRLWVGTTAPVGSKRVRVSK